MREKVVVVVVIQYEPEALLVRECLAFQVAWEVSMGVPKRFKQKFQYRCSPWQEFQSQPHLHSLGGSPRNVDPWWEISSYRWNGRQRSMPCGIGYINSILKLNKLVTCLNVYIAVLKLSQSSSKPKVEVGAKHGQARPIHFFISSKNNCNIARIQ